MRLPRLPTTKAKEPATQAAQAQPQPQSQQPRPRAPSTALISRTSRTPTLPRDSRSSRLSTRDPDVNRANVLSAIEAHYDDLKHLFQEEKLRRNETWRWLQDRGYQAQGEEGEGDGEDGEKKKVFRFITPPEEGEETVRVNASYIILKIHPEGQLEEVWVGVRPSELNARRGSGGG